MFEQSFKNIDNILRTDSGSATELDYVEQTSWILFLKYLDDLEEDKKKSAVLSGKSSSYILAPEYRWNIWACPKNSGGKLDHNKALDGDDLKDFVNNKLFPYLKKFKAEDSHTIEYKIGEIFSELKNKISSGYKLREILNVVDDMHFRLYEEKHELSHLYEAKIKNMGNAGRNGGEYYTPRPSSKRLSKSSRHRSATPFMTAPAEVRGFWWKRTNTSLKINQSSVPAKWRPCRTKLFTAKK